MTAHREDSSTRAEALRRKHKQESQVRYTNARKQVSKSSASSSIPMSSRTFANDTRAHSAATSQPRRKVIYAPGSNGAEIRMPAIPIVHFDWKMVSGALTVLLLVTVLLLATLPEFKIQSVQVQGIQRIPPGDIASILQSSNASLFTLDRTTAVKSISASFPELKDVRLQVSLTRGVVVTATERQPILAWTSGDQTLWIDQEGVVMPVRGEAGSVLTIQSSVTPPLTHPMDTTEGMLDYARLALANQSAQTSDEFVIPQIDPNVLHAAIELAARLPEGATLVYDPTDGMGWVDPRGWKVFFGIDLSDLQVKEAEYQVIVDHLTQQGITPVMISVEFPHAPYYRTE